MASIAAARRLVATGTVRADEPCVCQAAKAEHSGARHSGGHHGTGCGRYRADTTNALAVRALEAAETHPLDDVGAWLDRIEPQTPTPDGKTGVRPSDYGACRRRVWYRERPPDGMELDEVVNWAAVLGSIIHKAVREARKVFYPWRAFELAVDVPGLDRPGHLDSWDPILGKVSDLKSNGVYGWNQIGIDGVEEAHAGQADVYAYAQDEAGHQVDWVEIEYLNRSTGQLDRFTWAYDRARARKAVARLWALKLAIELGVAPPRDRRGPSVDQICAEWCEFRSTCWNIPAAMAAGRSPESYTLLGENPSVKQIEWAARRAYQHKRAMDDAKAEYEASRVLLVGIPDATYGAFTITERRRRMPDWKKWAELVRQALAEGATAQEAMEIEVPRRLETWVQVTPAERAADHASEPETGAEAGAEVVRLGVA